MRHILIVWFRTTFFSYLAGLLSYVLLNILLQDKLVHISSLLLFIYLFLNGFLSAGFASLITGLSIYQKQSFRSKPVSQVLQRFLPVVALPLLAVTALIGLINGFMHIELVLMLLNTFLHGYATMAFHIIIYQQYYLTEIYTEVETDI